MTISDIKNTLKKYAGLNVSALTKDYVLPSIATGTLVGSVVTGATSKDTEDFKKRLKKGLVAGAAGSAVEGALMGIWKQRDALKKLANSNEKNNK